LSGKRLLIIGLDGATLDLIAPWMEEGKLPTLAGLIDQGAHGELASTIPPMSAQAWTSFMTGYNIGKHGLVDFVMRRPDSYTLQIVNAKSRDGATLWGLLGKSGRRVAVLNVPMTYPPEEVNGFLVSGMDAPSLDSPFTFPPSLRSRLLEAVPGYVIESGGQNYLHGSRRQPERYIEMVLDVARARLDATRFLMEEQPWDLLVTVLRLTDTAQHWFWKDMDPQHPFHHPADAVWGDAIERIYRYADECIATLLQACDDDTTVMVLSDHGFGPMGDRVVYLNTWLQQQGFLRFQGTPGGGAPQFFVRRAVWPLWRGLKRHLPTPAKRWLKKTFPRLERRFPSMLALSGIDWSGTRAYALEVRPGIWIHLKGREPQGIVEPGAEYEALREEIIARLHEWRDPIDGQPVVARVWKREDLYHGPHLDRIPDLLLELRRPGGYGYHLQHGNLSDRKQPIETISAEAFFRTLRPNAGHTLNGICLIKGPHVRPGTRLSGANIVDMAPTALYLLGAPIPDDMDGRLLTEAIDPDWLAQHPPRYTAGQTTARDLDVPTYGHEESKEVEERLRGLGYLD
jgi:predicted AlkP superfamily phosphohydrolase/phosphomutase